MLALAIVAEGKSACKIAFCRVCLDVFIQNNGRGRRKKACQNCRQRHSGHYPKRKPCFVCQSLISSGAYRKKYCSARCAEISLKSYHKARWAAKRKPTACSIRHCAICLNVFSWTNTQRKICDECRKTHDGVHKACECKHCNKWFYPKKSDRIKYCSQECSRAEKKAKSTERIEKIKTDRLKRKATVEQARRNKRASAKLHKCFSCGIEFDRSERKFKHTCSDDCQSVKEQTSKQNSRKDRKQRYGGTNHRHRARRFGVHYEPVNVLKVFERDGWRCQICRKPTPRKLRGTYDDRAPELDHIVPLSKGGEHSYRNTQCACRKCNGTKSDNVYGQLPMFA